MNKQERKLKGYYKFKKSISRPKRCYCVRCSPKEGEPSPSTVKVYDAMKDSLEEYYDLFDSDCHPRHKRESEALDRIYPYNEDIFK